MEPALEQRLVERAQGGDLAAWELLYRALHAPLYHRVIRPRVPTDADAEDVLTETFQTALARISRYEFRGHSLFVWLARIARNKSVDLTRKRSREAARVERAAAHPRTPPPEPDARLSALSDARAAREQVEVVLERINPRYATALRLRMLEGLPREACAARLEVKVGTFDVLLLRATRAFKKQYGEVFGGFE